jgi:D-cysteine desulfhydrase
VSDSGSRGSTGRDLPRVALAHTPTPLVRRAQLDRKLGVELWIKRDDATGGAESGNKVRKLEWILGDALAKRCDTIITCGGIQSNHARATAIVCAQLGLRCVLFLRVAEGAPADTSVIANAGSLPRTGNVLLDRMAGAEIHLISREAYAHRGGVMEGAAQAAIADGKRPYVIPEGGSNGLGALGYVEAMREVRQQVDLGLAGARAPFDVVVHACGSGGTAAGVALGAAKYGVAARVRPVAVCDDAAYFEHAIHRIVAEARGYDATLTSCAPFAIDESARGPGYAVMSDEQLRLIADVARESGTILDPVYTGKAMHGLHQAVARGEIAPGARVLFLHTGGLPGLLAQGDALSRMV